MLHYTPLGPGCASVDLFIYRSILFYYRSILFSQQTPKLFFKSSHVKKVKNSYVAQSFSCYRKRLCFPTQKLQSLSIPIHTETLDIAKKNDSWNTF